MPWIRLDDQIAHHKKFLAAGPMASWLWVCGQSYSARYLTDGFVPSAALHSLGSVLNPKRYADKLVEVGLWECAEGGYRVHDYHDYQPTAEEVRHTREVRREAGREGGKRSGERRTGRNTSEANGKQNASGLLGACFDNVEAKPNPVPEKNVRTVARWRHVFHGLCKTLARRATNRSPEPRAPSPHLDAEHGTRRRSGPSRRSSGSRASNSNRRPGTTKRTSPPTSRPPALSAVCPTTAAAPTRPSRANESRDGAGWLEPRLWRPPTTTTTEVCIEPQGPGFADGDASRTTRPESGIVSSCD